MAIKILKWLLILSCCILTVEILFRSQLISTVRDMNNLYRKILRVIKSNTISDHWKEKVLPKYARLIFRGSLMLLVTLLLVFSPFIIAIFVTNLLNFNIQGTLASPSGLIATTLFALLYGFMRGHHAGR